MAKGSLIEQLDQAVEAVMADPDAPLAPVDPRVADLLLVVADLRHLPNPKFRARLEAELLHKPNYGKPLATQADIRARVEEMALQPKLAAYNLRDALGDLPERTMRFLTTMNHHTIGVTRSSTPSHWERHPAGDEMLHVLEGETDVITLTESGPVQSTVRAGSLFICPKGLWHRLKRCSAVSILFATPGEGTEHSTDEDPRPLRARSAGTDEAPALVTKAHGLKACDVQAVLRGRPELSISSATTAREAEAAFGRLTSLDRHTIGVMRYSGQTPWERHPDGDELLHCLEGEVQVTILTDAGPVYRDIRPGSVFVCPRGLWHRQLPRPAVTMLFATPTETTEVSFAEYPRPE